MTRNCHVPFCRAVGEATLLLTLIILRKANTVGRTEIQARPQTTHCLLGESLVDKVTG
jgi:putative transposase